MRRTYPEVNLKVSTSSELAVADLEGHGHQIILVQGLVEAFAGVSLQLDGVCGRGGGPAKRGDEKGSGGETHFLICTRLLLGIISNWRAEESG